MMNNIWSSTYVHKDRIRARRHPRNRQPANDSNLRLPTAVYSAVLQDRTLYTIQLVFTSNRIENIQHGLLPAAVAPSIDAFAGVACRDGASGGALPADP